MLNADTASTLITTITLPAGVRIARVYNALSARCIRFASHHSFAASSALCTMHGTKAFRRCARRRSSSVRMATTKVTTSRYMMKTATAAYVQNDSSEGRICLEIRTET